MLRLSFEILLPHLTDIINFSLSSGLFPTTCKQASVTALSKVRNPQTLSDTKAIAPPAQFSWLLERVVHDQLRNFITIKNLLSPYQSSYRKHHFTQTALLRILQVCRKARDFDQLIVIVSFDFSKAFDNVSPKKLLLRCASWAAPSEL